jgi:hypothetical protein
MNYTSFTAFIITIHHMSAILALIIAMIFSAIIYGVLIRKRKNRVLIMVIIFLVSLIIGTALAEEMLQKQPVSIETVQVG